MALPTIHRRAIAVDPAPRLSEAHAAGPRPQAPRRSKAQQRAEKLDKILDSAEYLFARHGLQGVTLEAVAKKVGVQAPLLHESRPAPEHRPKKSVWRKR